VHDVNFQNHGGLTIIHRDSVTVQKRLLDNSVSTFEYLCTYATSKLGRFVLFSLYRPGSQAVSLLFFDELAVAFEQLSAYNCPVIICGDFNIHVDQRDDPHVIQLDQLLKSFGYVQHVNESTHDAGHTLDLVITNGDTCIVDLVVSGRISDHSLILFRTCVKKPPTYSQWVTRRAWRRLSCDDFASDLSASCMCSDLNLLATMSADELASLYWEVMTDLLDRHCPLITVRHRAKLSTPWFDFDCR